MSNNNQHKRELVTDRKTASFSINAASQQLTGQLERNKRDAQIIERHNQRVKKVALDKELNRRFINQIMKIVTIATLFIIAVRLGYPLIKALFFGA